MSKHTPGPWTTNKRPDGVRMVMGNGYQRARVLGPMTVGDEPGYSEAEANCRLMAAAPDLLEAAKWMVTWADHIDDPDWDALVGEARAAIAKAEGAIG